MLNSFNIFELDKTCRYGILDISMFKDVPKREIEAKATRFLLAKLLNNEPHDLAYFETGKPYLKDRSEKISFSHSHDKVAVIIDETRETGIDIELIRDKVKLVAHKFINENERANSEMDRTEKLLVYWAAKETMYKIYGRKNLDFKSNLHVDPFEYDDLNGGDIIGHLRIDHFVASYQLTYKRIENYILVYSF